MEPQGPRQTRYRKTFIVYPDNLSTLKNKKCRSGQRSVTQRMGWSKVMSSKKLVPDYSYLNFWYRLGFLANKIRRLQLQNK